MSRLMEREVGSPDLERSRLEDLGTTEAQRVRRLLRRTCCRLAAPAALRQRILASLPHRGRDVGESRP